LYDRLNDLCMQTFHTDQGQGGEFNNERHEAEGEWESKKWDS